MSMHMEYYISILHIFWSHTNGSIDVYKRQEFGTRTEMKNLNSFKAIARAIEGERERQIELLEVGKKVVQETRRWDDNKESSHAMRSKEDARCV